SSTPTGSRSDRRRWLRARARSRLHDEGAPMPITPFLDDTKFDPEAKRVLGLAFEMARVALRLADPGDLTNEIIATQIIQLAKAGERHSHLLCGGVLEEFDERRP